MASASRFQASNVLLSKLTVDDVACLQPFERVQLARTDILVKANAPIASVFFLESGIASVHEVLRDGNRVGVGIVGYEGMTGWSVLLGCDSSPREATVASGDGVALSVPTERLLRACSDRPAINALFLRFVQCFMSQMALTITSNLRDPVERRLARWLLMNHDRLGGDEIHLTHDQLGVMLGVRRASVTDTLHILEGERLIRSMRGVIVISDRPSLETFAGEAYGVAEVEYARAIGPFAKLGAVP